MYKYVHIVSVTYIYKLQLRKRPPKKIGGLLDSHFEWLQKNMPKIQSETFWCQKKKVNFFCLIVPFTTRYQYDPPQNVALFFFYIL